MSLTEQEREAVDGAIQYARTYWQHGQEPRTQAALTTLARFVERILAARTEQAPPEQRSEGAQLADFVAQRLNLRTEQARPEKCDQCVRPCAPGADCLATHAEQARPEHVVKAEALREAAEAFDDRAAYALTRDWLRDRADSLTPPEAGA